MSVFHSEAVIGFDFGIGELFGTAAAVDAAATAAAATDVAATGAAVGATAAAGTAAAGTAAAVGTAAAGTAAAGTAAAGTGLFGGLISAQTAAEIGVGTSLASGALGAVGSIRTAEAQKDAANYQAAVDLNNQKLAGYYANTAAAKGASDLSREQQKAKQQKDLIVAAQGASGIDVASGSSEDVRRSQDILNNLDALTIMSNTNQQYYGYQVAGTNAGNEAGLKQLEASQTGAEAALGATSSLVSGASGAANQYLSWQRVAGGPTASFPSAGAATRLGNFY